MKVQKFAGKRLSLLSLLLVLALFVAACGQNEPEVVVAPETDAGVVESEAEVVEPEIVGEAEIVEPVVDEVDAVSVTTDTQTLVDTDVVTEIEVITDTTVAEVEVVTEVFTDTDVTVDRTTDTESEVTIETEDVDTSPFAIVIITDAAGNQFLGDPLAQRPIFASQQFLADERFEAIQSSDETILDAGLDQNLMSEVEEGGVRYLTYNNNILYRYVGNENEDWGLYAEQLGLSPLTSTGEFGEFAE
jgi:hypothetical protein